MHFILTNGVTVVWLQFHPFLSFLFLPSSACSAWYLSCWCCLHLGPLHVFLTPGRRNHFAYYNYHAYEGNTVFNTVPSLVTKNIAGCNILFLFDK